MSVGTSLVYAPERYEGDVSNRHIGPTVFSMTDEAFELAAQRLTYDYGRTPEEFNYSLDGVHSWGKTVMHVLPAGIDLALGVDDGGNTRRNYDPAFYSNWAESDLPGVFLRFAEARTAVHSVHLLRTPIDGRGIAIEATTQPESADIRDAHTLFIVEPKREEDARYPWAQPHPSRLFDMSEFDVKPFFAGPLYNGHPNMVSSKIRQVQVVELGLGIFKKLVS